MKKTIFIIIFSSLILNGCAKQTASREAIKESVVLAPPSGQKLSPAFQQQLASADHFLDLKHKGRALRAAGRYKEAAELFEEAFDKYAVVRPEHAMMAEDLGLTYEAMGILDEAWRWYEIAAEVTMNDSRHAEFLAKARDIKTKIGIDPYYQKDPTWKPKNWPDGNTAADKLRIAAPNAASSEPVAINRT